MTDQTKCPACGDGVDRELPWDTHIPTGNRGILRIYKCESQDGVTCTGEAREFSQSDACKLRQHAALLADCVAALRKYGWHASNCNVFPKGDEIAEYNLGPLGIFANRRCDCEFDQTLASLKQRIAALKGEE